MLGFQKRSLMVLLRCAKTQPGSEAHLVGRRRVNEPCDERLRRARPPSEASSQNALVRARRRSNLLRHRCGALRHAPRVILRHEHHPTTSIEHGSLPRRVKLPRSGRAPTGKAAWKRTADCPARSQRRRRCRAFFAQERPAGGSTQRVSITADADVVARDESSRARRRSRELSSCRGARRQLPTGAHVVCQPAVPAAMRSVSAGPQLPGSYSSTGTLACSVGSTNCQAVSTRSCRANSVASPIIASPSRRS
jgi:hypothetical protein